MEFILEWLSGAVISIIDSTGYAGIFILMALESANVPVPSEIIMPFSGYLVFQGNFSFWWVVFWGALGNLAGSVISYYLGFFGGRPFFEKYGKFFFVTKHDLELAEGWFQRRGSIIAFVSRMLPVVRTFISFPAGIAKMNILKFSIYTFTGSLIWSFFLTYVGVKMGENWQHLEVYFRKFDWAIVVLLVVGAGWWIWRHIKNIRHE